MRALGEVLAEGDRVSIVIDQENRDWGYNPCEDGTLATVVGFSEITYGRFENFGCRPGVHQNRSWVKLKLDDGKELTEWSYRLQPLDTQVYQVREQAWRKTLLDESLRDQYFIRELPETPFWEGDWVSSPHGLNDVGRPMVEKLIVLNIKHRYLRNTNFYDCSPSFTDGWRSCLEESSLKLIERGNVWKIAHGEKPTFKDLREEATLASKMGLTRDIRNPADGLYHWSVKEALAALKSDAGHSIAVGGSNFGGMFGAQTLPGPDSDDRSTAISVKTFKDADLGERVRNETLAGWGVSLSQSVE